jgi:hypothetical protein
MSVLYSGQAESLRAVVFVAELGVRGLSIFSSKAK